MCVCVCVCDGELQLATQLSLFSLLPRIANHLSVSLSLSLSLSVSIVTSFLSEPIAWQIVVTSLQASCLHALYALRSVRSSVCSSCFARALTQEQNGRPAALRSGLHIGGTHLLVYDYQNEA